MGFIGLGLKGDSALFFQTLGKKAALAFFAAKSFPIL
jgi:hypothetical protein